VRILVVDDVAETRHLYTWGFSLEGHTTQPAIHGAEAVTLLELGHYDAVLIDINMPVMDGIEAVRHIRQLPNGQYIPIVVLTGDRDEDCRIQALAAGADMVVFKPILPATVLQRLEECCQKRLDQHPQQHPPLPDV